LHAVGAPIRLRRIGVRLGLPVIPTILASEPCAARAPVTRGLAVEIGQKGLVSLIDTTGAELRLAPRRL
jgi:hypothetical protein